MIRPLATRRVLWGAAAVAAALAAGSIWWVISAPSRDADSPFPRLPALHDQPEALASQLRRLQRRARPGSAPAAGRLAMAYHANVYYTRAARCYALARTWSENWRWAYLHGLLALDQGRQRDAAGRFRRAAKRGGYGLAWFRLAQTRFKQARYAAAANAYERAETAETTETPFELEEPPPSRSRPPLEAYARWGRARVARQRGKPAEAREHLEVCLDRAPRFGAARRLLASAYSDLGKPEKARVQRLRARRLGGYIPPVDPAVDALVERARRPRFLLLQAGLAQRAHEMKWRAYLLRRAIRFNGETPELLLQLGITYRGMDRPRKTVATLEKYLEQVDGSAHRLLALRTIGDARRLLGQHTASEQILRRALRREPKDGTSHRVLAMVLKEQQRRDAALEHARRATELNPSDQRAFVMLGELLLSRGKVEEGLANLRRAVELAPASRTPRRKLRRALLRTGHYRRAVEEYRVWLKIQPNAATRTTLSMILSSCPDPGVRDGEEALAAAKRAADRVGRDHARVLDALAAAHAELGRFERARKLAERAVTRARKRGMNRLRMAIRRRERLYRQGKPYRLASRPFPPP